MTLPLWNNRKRPVRINKITIKVRRLVTDTVMQDVDFRETRANRSYSDPIELVGQITGMKGFWRLERTATGDMLPSTADFVFRRTDLEHLGIDLKKGDRIVEIDGEEVDFNIIQVSPEAPFGGNRQKSNARPLLWFVSAEQQKKKLGSV